VTAAIPEAKRLVLLGPGLPLPWPTAGVEADAFGELCADEPDALALWAPGEAWPTAFRLLAMYRSALPERCLVLTDRVPPLEVVPVDGRVAVAAAGRHGPIEQGRAPYRCADLRGERIFRLLLTGRTHGQADLEPLLGLHVLAVTTRGRWTIERWRPVLRDLFADGLEGAMPEPLHRDLSELGEAARAGEYAVIGGYHKLHRTVRGPAEWEAGARKYLTLAATRSPSAMAAVERWLGSVRGWAGQPAAIQERSRRTAARMLHWLADDPWISGERLLNRLGEVAAS
jgi:hypothetical protein